MPNYWATL